MSQPAYNPEVSGPPPPGWVPPDSKNFGEPPPPYPGTNPPAYPVNQSGYSTGASYPPMAPTSYNETPTYVPPVTATVVMTGNCPRCHVGNLVQESNTGALVCIIILVILFFPIGLLYLLCLPGAVERRCHNCGYCVD